VDDQSCPVDLGWGLQERLVFALQFLFEDDSSHVVAVCEKSSRGVHVRSVHANVMSQFARLAMPA
jgi:hypothetical protein